MLQILIVYSCMYVAKSITCDKNVTTIAGSGGVFPAQYYDDSGNIYATNRSHLLGQRIEFHYDDVNSAYGLQGIQTGISLNFAAGQIVLNTNDLVAHPNLVTFPLVAGAIVVVFNLPDVDHLYMTKSLIAEIYIGNVTRWDDPKLRRINPNLMLPSRNILLVARSDRTADTNVFTEALSRFSGEWKNNFGTFSSNNSNWPDSVEYFAKKPIGLTGLVSSIPYAIGYCSQETAIDSGLNYVTFVDEHNISMHIDLTESSIKAAINYWYSMNNVTELVVNLSNANDSQAYPIVTFSFITIDTKSVGLECCSVRETVGWIYTLLTDPAYRHKAENYYFATLRPEQTDFVIDNILKTITCGGENVFDSYMQTLVVPDPNMVYVWAIVAVLGTLFVVGILLILFLRRYKRLAVEKTWLLPASNFRLHIQVAKEENLRFPLPQGTFNEEKVFAEELKSLAVKRWNPSAKALVSRIKQKISHSKLLDFRGIVVSDGKTLSLHATCPDASCPKGSLHYVLANSRFELSEAVRKNLISDVVDGLAYLHSKEIIHGGLSSLCCYIEQSWSVKIASWFNSSIYLATDKLYEFELPKINTATTSKVNLIQLIYVDPEMKRKTQLDPAVDTYSFAMLVAEVFTGKIPYQNEVDMGHITFNTILQSKFQELFTRLPKLPISTPANIVQLVTACLRPMASDRPLCNEISTSIWGSEEKRTGIVDSMMANMELYMLQLQNVTGRMQDLLHEMLPVKIADKLFNGGTVEPEQFDCVSIYFSDICGFTDISAHSTPAQVMGFLNDLWTVFDSVLEKFDAYKVDTIGDAYMVASGIPERNGMKHVIQIATLAIELLKETKKFGIPHMPGETLKIRIGLNSGPVVAGVVGKKMPQYCIFGDAVNTAARMESTSLPLKIQASEAFANLLADVDTKNEFSTELRGTIQVKGKGLLKTYWLLTE